MFKPLLIEIGVEELPAVPLLKELKNIEKKYTDILQSHSLFCEFEFYYTPRRLVLWHREFPAFQQDTTEEFFGAPLEIAYKDSKPTKAAEGFAKKCGVSLDEITKTTKGNKEVLYYKKEVKGKDSALLLESIVNEWVNSLDFGKSMRWGKLQKSFIRPVRWLNIIFGGELIDAELFGVKTKMITYVHRSSDFEAKQLEGMQDYFYTLREGGVVLFQDERRQKILKEFKELENSNNIEIEIDNELLDEVVAITENPTALLGSFDEEFLRLPPEVIITSMKEHQRYFPVFKDGKLINKFVVVSNALTKDFTKVIEGNERVLRPRLADGLFFWDNDIKNKLSTKGLEKVAFFKGLGSVKDKISRELKIALALYEKYKISTKKEDLSKAVNLAKADLMSEMVYEFTELQGLMGGYYALAQGENKEVATAITEQYLPEGEDSPLPSTPMSAIVAMSIKIDTILALFSVNQIPTGSRDPFALRRAVNGIIRICTKYNFKFDISKDLQALACGYDKIEMQKLENFFIERIRQYHKVNPSIVEAVLSTGEREILAIGKKIHALDTIANSKGFSEAFSTFKRVANITKDIKLSENLHVDTKLFCENAEKVLYEKYIEVCNKTYISYEDELDALLGLKPQLDNFFDNVMVNVDDENIKNNRKAIIASIYKSILNIADIKEVKI